MKTGPAKPHLVLFFTFDVSLAVWRDQGMLSREIAPYKRLADDGWTVTFLTYGLSDEEVAIVQAECPAGESQGISVIAAFDQHRPASAVMRLLQSPWLLWRARKILRKADIYKTNQIWGGWNAALARWLFGKPLLARGGYEPWTFAKGQHHSPPRIWFTRLIAAMTYKAAARIHMATEADLDVIRTHFPGNERKLALQRNWVDVTLFQPGPATYDARHLLFIGRFTRQKNLDRLFDALKNSDFHLHMVGSGDLDEHLRARVTSENLPVTFHGRMDNHLLAGFLRQFQTFVLPSLFEGNPKVLLEAMATGLGIAASDAPGINNLIKDGIHGRLFPMHDAAAIKDALEQLASDASFRQKTGENARGYIMEHASLDANMIMESQILQRLAQEGRAKHDPQAASLPSNTTQADKEM